MNKEWSIAFYKAVGRHLTAAAERRKISVAQIARWSGQQYNTIEAALNGNRFSFHQATWISGELGISIDHLIKTVNRELIQEGLGGTKKKESTKENQERTVEDFI